MIFTLAFFFFFKQKTAYEMRISDWSSDVCSSDLRTHPVRPFGRRLDERLSISMSWRQLPITRVDAFADRPFTGNPAAVMPLDEWLSDALLLAIAAENNLSETAFLIPDEAREADYELRWKSEERRVGEECVSKG